MNIEFERSVEDVIDFHLFHFANSPSMKREVFLTQLLTGVFVIPLVIFGSYLAYPVFNIPTLIIALLAGVLIFAIYPTIYRKTVISRIKKVLKEGNNSSLVGHQSLDFSPDGIFSKSPVGEGKINWSSISKVVQSEKCFYLYTSSLNALVVPKSCFRSDKEQRDFQEYVNSHLSPK